MLKFFKKHKTETTNTLEKIPQHIAFICDGNRRWAEMRGLPPLEGHRAGISNFENMIEVDENGKLVDGYTTYVLAKGFGWKEIEVIVHNK